MFYPDVKKDHPILKDKLKKGNQFLVLLKIVDLKQIIIAIDGYSGTGKSSTAKAVAKALDYIYIDSGAMYRAVTWYFLKHQIDLNNEKEISEALRQIKLTFEGAEICINGQHINTEIRSMLVNENVSQVATIKIVRENMVKQQQELGKSKAVVMDGRDIGTIVFPEASLKIFMTANADTRAERRKAELASKGINEEFSIIKANLLARDNVDSTRLESPLKVSEGAIVIDTSQMSFQDQVDKVVALAKKVINEN